MSVAFTWRVSATRDWKKQSAASRFSTSAVKRVLPRPVSAMRRATNHVVADTGTVSGGLSAYLDARRADIEAALADVLPSPPDCPAAVAEAMRYSLTAGGKTWQLSAGPSWFWGDKNPLNAYVGKSVSIAGSTHAGDTELDVDTVDGKVLREGGKPPWAGGPWVIGKTHPGWKDWMAGGKPGKGLGRETAPGQLKDKTSTD